MEPDQEPFLQWKQKHEPFSEDDLEFSKSIRVQPKIQRIKHAFFHILLILFYTTLSILVIKWQTLSSTNSPNSLPNLTTKYSPHIQIFTDTTYSGLPSSDVDKAWDTLMSPMKMRVSSSELARHNQTSAALPGGGNLIWLGVFHQLHCVRLIRQFVYLDHYIQTNLTEEDMYHIKSHADHCLEVLRQAAMCAGDTSLTVVKWEKGKRSPGVDLEGHSVHWCVDWEGLMDSTAHRVVGEEEFATLKNPLNDLEDKMEE